MVRKGYTQCATCHVSPSGGGLLTEYGRALSQEALSRGQFFFERALEAVGATEKDDRSREAEAAFFYGTIALPKGLNLGGDLRLLQTFVDSPSAVSGRFIPMQADLEAAYKTGRLTLLAAGGRRETGTAATSFSQVILSRRHWVSVDLGPQEKAEAVQVRAGRFFPAFGVMDPDHTLVTRRGLGFDQERETYNLEASVLGELGQVSLAAVGGRFNSSGAFDTSTAAVVAQAVLALGTSYRVGLDGYVTQTRLITGAHAILGFTPEFFAWTQADLIRGSAGTLGWVEATQLGWEFARGIQLYARQEYLRDPDLAAAFFSEAYTLGLKYYPRTHWEFLFGAQKARDRVVPTAFDTVLTAQLHYNF